MSLRAIFTTRGVILLALAAMVVLSFISYRSIVKLNRLAAEVDHTHVVQLNLQTLYSELSDADSELKAFLITKDSTYYNNLMEGRIVIHQLLEKLTNLTDDNPGQQRGIALLNNLILARRELVDVTLKAGKEEYDYYSAELEDYNAQLKASIQQLHANEERLLATRTDLASQYQATAPVSLLTIQIAIIVCLLAGFMLVTADLRTKERLQKETLQRNKELQEQRDFIQGIFDNTVDVILIFDLNFKVLSLNKRAKELYDPHDHIVGKNLLEAFPQARGSHFAEGISNALTGKYSHSGANESTVYKGVFYESFFVPLYSADKTLIGAMSIHHDVSDILKMTHDIRVMNDQLKKSNDELEQFAFVASHDLQEPLRKIETFSDIAKHNLDNKEIVSKNLDKLISSASRMSALIKDILHYSRVSNATTTLDEIDLNEVLDQVLQDFELRIAEKEAIIEPAMLPRVMGSRQQLTQVFGNIISNALKFCTTAPCVKITCRHVDDNFEIAFVDNGIGFDQRYAEQIFGVFQRLHHRSEFSGTGIGLALCKRIMENHHGQIKATSTPGKGTTITITLPDKRMNNKAHTSNFLVATG